MADWAGFSEEELRRMQQKEQAAPNVPVRGRRPPPTNRSRQQLQQERVMQQAAQLNGAPSISPEQQLSRPKSQPSIQTAPAPALTQEKEAIHTAKSQQNEPRVQGYPKPQGTEAEKCPVIEEPEKQQGELREKTGLQHLQQEQRFMEEKNKRKKALLSKAIAERSKRTQAEAVKLKRIQKELQTLDDMVSNDIGILRSCIEQASWEYSQARKRFEKAEVEYVSAKLDLHKKMDVKEQLTEHLYTIIQQNELRKAYKLEELMMLLEMETDEERLELEIEVERLLQHQEAQSGNGEGNSTQTGDQAKEDCSSSASGGEESRGQ
ncbi:RAB6-interacting golgin-like [Acipenser oxyrinchus oxyrinchus]|uniref:RAB6-interacting golgin n=1 Tax=Acipenser oxyrinchus oxyrinchus TaxID=40147 RepID=A0AAD8G1A6_ACIOX|nr:RAB6-interacting golgin-like [Acipenser oxyrinchus oxyrinchus]